MDVECLFNAFSEYILAGVDITINHNHKRGRGRPKGSKNKQKDEPPAKKQKLTSGLRQRAECFLLIQKR